MTFAHPWMLAGAAAALVPLLIHLFDRRRPRAHPFAAISFVLRSQRRTASRLRLKRLLLYALRTLILLAIPVALARPQWTQKAAAALRPRGPAATAVVLDASLSMRFSEGKSLFEIGRGEARDALRDLAPEEPATFLLCDGSASPPPAPGFDRGRLRAAIDEAQPGYGPIDMVRCLTLAARALEDSPVAGKRLVLISSLTSGAFRLDVSPPTVKGPRGENIRPELVVRDVVAGQRALPNHSIVDLKIEPALQAGPRAFQFTFNVRNISPEAVRDLQAELKIGDRVVAKGFVDIPPNGTVQKVLTHPFEQGGAYAGEVILKTDALSEDDHRAFVVNVPRTLRALVIDGEPNPIRFRDEAFFVEAALNAPGSSIEQTVRDVDSGLKEPFESYDVVLLLNASAPNPQDAQRLTDFVERGGGLFISMGDHVEPAAYNARFGKLLPRRLRDVRTSAMREDPDADRRAARLGQISATHPIFTPFVGQAREGLVNARFYRYVLLESGDPANESGSEVIAAYEDGAPAFAIARRGKGRVVLYTSTVDRDWSDLSIRTAFLPLVQRVCAFLTGALEEHAELRARVGDSITLRPDGREIGKVRGPTRELTALAQQDGSLRVGPLPAPGIYQPLDPRGEPIADLAFAATLDPSASDLTRLKPEELPAYFGEESVRTASTESAQRSVPFWTWLIVAAVVAFFLEGTLLRK